jgi:hypothetical protein
MAANDNADKRTLAETLQFVRQVIGLVPEGSLLHLEYVPASGIRPEVAQACRVLGMDPRTYFVEFTGAGTNDRGEPLIYGRVLNRGNELRTFAPLKGKLTKIEVLRRGPKA